MRGKTYQLQSGEALGEVPMLAVAAHELKAPLVLLRQLSLLLGEQLDDEMLRQQTAQRMLLTSERSLRLMEMLTKQTRLEDGLFRLETVHVGHVCEEVAHELTPLAREMNRKIEVNVPRRAALAVANYDLLRSIALGLCDNALAYAGDDQRSVQLSTGQKQHGSRVRLAVRDFGPTMPADVFRQLQSTLGKSRQPIGRRPSSSGLGLLVAGQFAEVMRGEIGVRRHQLGGATFFVDLPASAQLSLL